MSPTPSALLSVIDYWYIVTLNTGRCKRVAENLDGRVVSTVGAVPAVPGHVRIDWWGAALCRPRDDSRSELVYLDRENQGGRLPD